MKKGNKKQNHVIGSTLILILFLLVVFWQGNRIVTYNKSEKTITSISDISDVRIGMLLGASYSESMEARFSDCSFYYYASYADMIEDLQAGRIDTYFVDEPVGIRQQQEAGGIRLLDTLLTNDEYGFVISLDRSDLCESLNQVIEEMYEDGTMEYLQEKWLVDGLKKEPEQVEETEFPNGVLRIATNADSAPFSYNYNNELVGFDVDVVTVAAARLGYQTVKTQYAFGSLISSIVTGKEDIAVGGITHTEERSRSVLFTDTVYERGVVAVVSDDTVSISLFDNISGAISKTLIIEKRWQQVLSGIAVTVGISVVSLFLGTLSGIWFSVFNRSENRITAVVFKGIGKILETLPLLILLMFLYYVFFASVNISATLIAVIGLTLSFTATVDGLIQTGYLGLDQGQLEAAAALGYKDRQIFFKIALPQIASQMQDQYLGAATTLIKDTAIVGYITVQDITNILDTIRSATYQAFFPLLLTAFIYFVLAKVIVFGIEKALKYVLNRRLIIVRSDEKKRMEDEGNSEKGDVL